MADELKTMAEELKTTAISKLPEAISVSEGDCILVVQNRKAKKARPSLFRGPKGDIGLTGATGANPVLKFSSRGIEAKLSNQADSAFTLLVPIASITGPTGPQGLTGATGANIIPRAGETGIEYKLSTEPDTAYRLLVPYSLITGPQGEPGKDFQILGYFDTLDLLKAGITTPNPGDAYGIGTEAPYPIYIWDGINNLWRDNGAIQGPAGRSGKSARVNTDTGYWEEFDDDAQTWKQTEAIAVYPVATAERDGLMSKDDKTKLDQMKGGDIEVSKANIEKVFTGNITTHTHDTERIITEMPTDVWDGMTVSTALAGSGTKDDPYLIQSCADYIHFYRNPSLYSHTFEDEPSEEQMRIFKQVRFTSNLDFDNHSLDFESTVINPNAPGGPNMDKVLALVNIDGQGCCLSNLNFLNTWAVIPLSMYCSIKNIHVISGIFTIPLSLIHDKEFDTNSGNDILLTSWGLLIAVSIAENVSFGAEIKFTGDMATAIKFVFGAIVIPQMADDIPGMIIGDNPCCYSYVTYSGDEGLNNLVVIQHIPAYVDSNDASISVIGYDCTEVIKDISVEPTQGLVVGMIVDESKAYTLYVNTDNALPIYNDSVTTPFHIGKTTAEMKSPEFLALLNGDTETFVADTDNINDGYPIFKPNQVVQKIDGYVRESAFEAFKNNIPAGGADNVYHLDIDISGVISSLDTNVQTTIFGKTYTAPTSENIVELLGGNESIRQLYQKLAPENNTIVVVPYLAYVYPSRLISTAVMTMSMDSDNNFTPIHDGCNIAIMLQFKVNISYPSDITVGILISNFNTNTQSATYSYDLTEQSIRVENSLTSSSTTNALSANRGNELKNLIDGKIGSAEITTIKKLTQADYDALSPKNSQTLYVIVG